MVVTNDNPNAHLNSHKSTSSAIGDSELLSYMPQMMESYMDPQSPYSMYPWSAWPGSPQVNAPYSPAMSPCNSPSFTSTHYPQPQKTHQRFQFIDQTPDMPNHHASHNQHQKQNIKPLDRSIDLEKSRIAQQRRRDRRGKFLRNEVAHRLEELEQQLQEKEFVCDSLRNTLKQRDDELESLKQHFQELMNQRAQQGAPTGYLPHPVQFVQVPHSVCTTNRNYVLVPSPNPAAALNRAPFMEKIDYSKIQLRKTEQLDDEKREVLSSQEEWEERQRCNDFLAKIEAQARWQALQFQQQASQTPYYGGAPSNIYPETQNKVGNLPVSAFTTKVDLSTKRQALLKKNERSLEQLLLEDEGEDGNTRIVNSSDDLSYRRNIPSSPSLVNSDEIRFWGTNADVEMTSPKSTRVRTTDPQTPNTQTEESTISPRTQKMLGGPPSNIYPPPEKIGNLQVPAFTTKVDYTEVPLRRTTDGKL